MQPTLLDILRCPACLARLELEGGSTDGRAVREGALRCAGCGRAFPVEAGMPRLLDDTAPGIVEKRREIEGWVQKAKQEGWYEPEDDVDAALPFVTQLGWTDPIWLANEYSFARLLDFYVRPGMRVLELGAAKAWASQHLVARGCEYVATDILADPAIGIGRGEFYERRSGPFERVQADGERLPFADGSFDLTYCVATLHHALDLTAMVAEMSRVTRRGGTVAALNEGTRGIGVDPDAPNQEGEKALGINEHVHTPWAYMGSFLAAGLAVRRVIPSGGQFEAALRSRAGRLLLRVPRGETLSTLAVTTRADYAGISIFALKLGGPFLRRRRRPR
jgi:uncharacterized protein YbaR (Trm112 family)/ubiquinone/menaquinone biosynthesis C-methylase UbiE